MVTNRPLNVLNGLLGSMAQISLTGCNKLGTIVIVLLQFVRFHFNDHECRGEGDRTGKSCLMPFYVSLRSPPLVRWKWIDRPFKRTMRHSIDHSRSLLLLLLPNSKSSCQSSRFTFLDPIITIIVQFNGGILHQSPPLFSFMVANNLVIMCESHPVVPHSYEGGKGRATTDLVSRSKATEECRFKAIWQNHSWNDL